jgi:N-dimethylarginine dimethylaminohydrolase
VKLKRTIQIALLLFVAVSVVYFVGQESRRSLAAAPQPASQAVKDKAVHPAKVVAYYFHGDFRCVSCRKLEAVSQKAVMSGFSEELQRGDLQWQTVNVEKSENEHFISDYRLFSRSLVIVKFKDGKQVQYKTLMKAWELLQDDEALKMYVQYEVRAYLQET